MQETQVWCLGREDPLEKGMATYSRTLAWTSHVQRSLEGYKWGHRELDTTEWPTLTGQCRGYERHRFYPWVGKILWRRAWQLIPVFLPGESHGQWRLAGYIQSIGSQRAVPLLEGYMKQLSMYAHMHTSHLHSLRNHFFTWKWGRYGPCLCCRFIERTQNNTTWKECFRNV